MAEVKVYSTPTCPWCAKTKEYLKQKGVDFDDINVAEDIQGRTEMMHKSGQMGVPQIEINGRMIIGFNKEALDEELSKLGETGDDADDSDEENQNAKPDQPVLNACFVYGCYECPV